MMTTDYMGAFSLTQLLMVLLLNSPVQSRIVNVSSFTHRCENYPQYSSQVPSNVPNSPNCTENDDNDDENEEGEEEGGVGGETSNKRVLGKKVFSPAEDEALISSFMQHSQDPTVGTNQRKRDMWVKVKALYDKAREANPGALRERTAGMLGSRWRRIAAGVMKFVGHYEEAGRRRKSGMSEDDVISEALKLHGTFLFERQWLMLKSFRKWENTVNDYLVDNCKGYKNNVSQNIDLDPDTPTSQTPDSQGSGKRSRDQFLSEDGEGSISKRPMGIKAAKMIKSKGKSKSNVIPVEFLAETIQGFSEVHRERLEMTKRKEARKEKQMELELRRLELEEKRQQDGENARKWNVVQTLLQRNDLNSQEEELKITLLKDLKLI